jgi:alpha-mannosidase
MISLDDGKTEMAVVVDTTMGGSSMSDGSLEVMVHRRCQHDDSRGVQEPLNGEKHRLRSAAQLTETLAPLS